MSLIFQEFLSFFSSNKSRAISEGVITLEEYLQISSNERNSLHYLFSPHGRQAMAEGVITPEQYLKIPGCDRATMKYLFSPDGRQAVAKGDIGFEQYLKIPSYDRDMTLFCSASVRAAVAEGILSWDQYFSFPSRSRRNIIMALQDVNTRQGILNSQSTLETVIGLDSPNDLDYYGRQAIVDKIIDHWGYTFFLSLNGRQAVDEGVITFKQYLQIPPYERRSMQCLFSADGRQAVNEGVITLKQYLQIPCNERQSMEYLFTADGRQAVAEGVITLKQYLKIPPSERNIKYLFSAVGRQAVAEGVITLKQYLKMPWSDRNSMKYLFSADGRQAVAEGVITLKQYLEMPWGDRMSMQYLFSADGRQAVADSFITLERYLQIPDDQRRNMQYLFSPDGRQAITNGIFTFDQYLKIPRYEADKIINNLFLPEVQRALTEGIFTFEQYLRLSKEYCGVEYFFSSDDHRQAIAEGMITFEQYLQIPDDERFKMQSLFSADGRQAVAEGMITVEQYLQIPDDERFNMRFLFSADGRQAVAEGMITVDQYLQIPSNERFNMRYLFSADGRQAVAAGIITLDQYLQIPDNDRVSMRFLFSANGRQAIAEGMITVEQYLQIPFYQRENAMTALRYPDVRQRIINAEITIDTIIDLYPVGHPMDDTDDVIPSFNDAQSTHTASVHHFVSESAIRLANRYKLEIAGPGLEKTIEKVQCYIENLSDDSEKNRAAKHCLLEILAPDYVFVDPKSKVSIKQLLALVYLAIHDSKNREGELEDGETQFVEGLYEIQRGYNLSQSGIEKGGFDEPICRAGAFNKLIEKLQGIHSDCQIQFITRETASLKLPIVALEETKEYLKKFAKSNTDEAQSHLITQLKNEGVEIIWEHIKDNIIARMFDEFGSVFTGITDPNFVKFVEGGKNIELDHLTEFQKAEQSINYLDQGADNIEIQEEAVIGSNETPLVELVKNVKLESSNTFQPKTIPGIDDLKIQQEIVEGVIEDAKTLQQEETASSSDVIDINQKNSIYNQINLQLNQLENKAKNLSDRDHILAFCKACNIIYRLRELNHNYFIKKKINYEFYKEKALDILNQERPELDKHRGFKQIIGNLLILITTLGTGQLLNKVCTGNFLFFKTNSAKYVDELSHTIKEMGVCSIP